MREGPCEEIFGKSTQGF